MVSWFRREAEHDAPRFAEFQAVRLALRLAARYAKARVFTGNKTLNDALQQGRINPARIARLISCNERDAIGEVLALPDLSDVTVGRVLVVIGTEFPQPPSGGTTQRQRRPQASSRLGPTRPARE
jgi:hypothetical protein